MIKLEVEFDAPWGDTYTIPYHITHPPSANINLQLHVFFDSNSVVAAVEFADDLRAHDTQGPAPYLWGENDEAADVLAWIWTYHSDPGAALPIEDDWTVRVDGRAL